MFLGRIFRSVLNCAPAERGVAGEGPRPRPRPGGRGEGHGARRHRAESRGRTGEARRRCAHRAPLRPRPGAQFNRKHFSFNFGSKMAWDSSVLYKNCGTEILWKLCWWKSTFSPYYIHILSIFTPQTINTHKISSNNQLELHKLSIKYSLLQKLSLISQQRINIFSTSTIHQSTMTC